MRMATRVKLESQRRGSDIGFLDQRKELPLYGLLQYAKPRKMLDIPLDVSTIMNAGYPG